MIIDCDTCTMKNTTACDDCIVSALAAPGGLLELADDERSAIDEMSRIGLIAPIRLDPASGTG